MHILSPVRSCWIGLGCLALGWIASAAAPRPNIVLVMMDDMGYGDLSCHGSPFIQTPHLDALHASGVRLTDFHVAPMCSPTRGQLLTGRDALRNGASIIASSRMMVRADVPMMPAMFAAAGYATALFGKWHLGENHSHRPQDRGFQETLWFPMQEISSLPDHWGNDYFDPALRRWPEESGLAIRAVAPAWTPRDTATPDHAGFPAGVVLPIAGAQLRVGEQRVSATVADADRAAVFRLPLKAARTEVEATFQDADGKHLCPAFFVTIRRAN